jgi:hypothetical protein
MKRKPFGKLNCTNVEEVIQSDKAVIGTLHISTYHGKVLFDTRATTSFISREFIDAYRMRCNKLAYPITILSDRGIILVTHIRKQQGLMICGNMYYMDLYVIPMRDIVVLLGMDWLSNHGPQIDSGENTIAIREPGGGKAIYQGDKHTHMEVEL